ncbi:hypothetical protein [Sulfuricurvum sp.]|uniref:hypothetical protein n=1 Tax=Sulfuricurvum sp. TaxID=2025608 RepID=UPI003BB4F4DE
MKTLLLLIFSSLILLAQDQSVYTLTGEKDPRLDARYTITYVATNLKEGCGSRGYTTGTMKPSITQRSMSVPDGNYSINLPIYMTPEEDKEGCGYRFGGLELMILRKNDDQYFQYARFKLLGDYKNIDPISLKELGGQRAYAVYDGRKGGTDGRSLLNKKESPYAFRSDKRYFRITPKTTFVCMTRNSIYDYEQSTSDKETTQRLGNTDFTCTMKMKLDTDGGKYHYHECTKEESRNDSEYECGTMSHPDFGVDEITSDTLHIDIVVDESKCVKWRHLNHNFGSIFEADSFQELPKSSPSVMESLKSLF